MDKAGYLQDPSISEFYYFLLAVSGAQGGRL